MRRPCQCGNRIDDQVRLCSLGLTIAHEPNRIFAAFGDMMRVPGAKEVRSNTKRGSDVRIVYSPGTRWKSPKESQQGIIFFAIGFETKRLHCTHIDECEKQGIRNFTVFCNHVTIVPAIRAILDSPDMRLDGFIGPDTSPPSSAAALRVDRQKGRQTVVTSGFEPLDLLQSIVMLLRQLRASEAKVENQYKRVVPWEGNRAALRVWRSL